MLPLKIKPGGQINGQALLTLSRLETNRVKTKSIVIIIIRYGKCGGKTENPKIRPAIRVYTC